MSERLTRKDIKRKDQFISTVEHTVDYSRSHLRIILGTVIAVVVAIALTVATVTYLRHRTTVSNQALAEAMEAYSAPLTNTGTPLPEGYQGPSFANAQARQARAEELFRKVTDAWGSSPAAEVAAVYLAAIAVEKNDLDTAQKLWREFLEDQQGNVLAMQVQLNLLELRRARGEAEAVASELQSMLSAEQRPLPEDVLLFQLATTLEKLGRNDEALTHYQRLVDEFPQSGYGSEARVKTSQLGDLNVAAR